MDEQQRSPIALERPQSEGITPAAGANVTAATLADCPTCGQPTGLSQGASMGPNNWSGLVYAIGRLTTQFPILEVEKEFTQLTGKVAEGGLLETALLRRVLEDVGERGS